ncbi:hypothetical protein [Streptosporangium sp. NPDC049078]|uniref:hypothetical protein n=1 Tax=Streptosporangium sp. NPDC049078 TaxID=3155767 RepID=UPI00341ED762
MTPNPAVADRARLLADAAPGGSLARRTAGCVVVAYSTTRTDAHARKVLAELPEDLRAECDALADEITSKLQEEES